LWGAGGIYFKLINHYPELASDRYILLDGNASLHGLRICDKEVWSTSTTFHLQRQLPSTTR